MKGILKKPNQQRRNPNARVSLDVQDPEPNSGIRDDFADLDNIFDENVLQHEECVEVFDVNPGLPQSKIAQEFYFKFPEKSDDPTIWCRTPREAKKVAWEPNRLEGDSEFNFHADSSPAIMYLTTLKEAVEKIVLETNRYARIRKEKGLIKYPWKDIEINEFIVFLGVFLSMHASPKPQIEDYWYSEGLNSTPAYAQAFPLRRFKEILQNLHLVDSEEADEVGLNDPKSEFLDKAHKCREVIELATAGMRKARAPGRNLCLDEAMVPFRGSSALVQCVPGKPDDTGIKVHFSEYSK